MKNIITLLIFTFVSIACYSQPTNNAPQERNQKHNNISKQEIDSQKIAYFTQELELTPEEAQKFWPIYNEQGREKNTARHATLNSLKVLDNALESKEEISDKKIEELVNNYLNNYKAERDLFNKNYEDIKKILPLKKAAKLFNAEEKFRIMLIRQLRGNGRGN